MSDHLRIEARLDRQGSGNPVMLVVLNGDNITKTVTDIGVVTRDVCGGPVDIATVNGVQYPGEFAGPETQAGCFEGTEGGALLWSFETPTIARLERLTMEHLTK